MSFRTTRSKLPPDAFASGPDEPDPPPIDLIEEEVWNSIVSSPDDVSIRTSDNHGTLLKYIWHSWDKWNEIGLRVQSLVSKPTESPIVGVLIDASDYFESSIYNALIGFYRDANSPLRNALENLSIGSYLTLENNYNKYADWTNDDIEISFRNAANFLNVHTNFASIEQLTKMKINDDLYSQGGLIRRHYRYLCKFVHGAKGYNNIDLWEGSNGPIYVPSNFSTWASNYSKTYAIGLLIVRLTIPTISSSMINHQYNNVLNLIPKTEDGYLLLLELKNLIF